jgi:hypothetical protein
MMASANTESVSLLYYAAWFALAGIGTEVLIRRRRGRGERPGIYLWRLRMLTIFGAVAGLMFAILKWGD